MGQDELARLLGKTSHTTVQKWESGISTPPLITFIKMAEIFDVDLDDFARVDLSSPEYQSRSSRKSMSVPVYGNIPAGIPIEAIEDISDYIEISGQMGSEGTDFFALRLTGESMMPKYESGDIVLFEHQNVCENGDECAVRLAGEDATFKKIRKFDHSIILQPLNPEYDPIQIDAADNAVPIEILGIAREIRRKV